MQTDFCHYHLDHPSVWQCSVCQRRYCTDCIPDNDENSRGKSLRCTICSGILTYLGAANTAQPFWERIGSFFKYPFHHNSLIMLGILSIANAIFNNFFISLLLTCVFTKYLYYVLEQTSLGATEPPTAGTAFSGKHLDLFFKQLIVLIGLIGLILLVARFTHSAALTAGATLFVVLMLPASIMVLAMEKEIAPAINVAILWQVASCIGWRYLIVFIYASMLWFSPAAIFYVLMDSISPFVLMGLSSLISNYFLIVTFHMLGYVIFQYQSEFGFAAGLHGGEHDTKNEKQPVAAVIAASNIYLLEGKHDEALSTLAEGIKNNPGDIGLHDRYHQLLKTLNQIPLMVRHATTYLEVLHQVKNYAKAANVYMDCYNNDKDFLPSDPALCHQLAAELFVKRQYQAALFLLTDMRDRHPHYVDFAEVYFLTAKIYCEGLQKDEEALKLLCLIEQQFSTHPTIIKDVEKYIEFINNIRSSGTRA